MTLDWFRKILDEKLHIGHKCEENEKFVIRWFGNEQFQTIHSNVIFGDNVILPIRVLQLKTDPILIDMDNVTTSDGAAVKLEANVVLSIKDDNPNQLLKTLQNPDAGIVETNHTISLDITKYKDMIKELHKEVISKMTQKDLESFRPVYHRAIIAKIRRAILNFDLECDEYTVSTFQFKEPQKEIPNEIPAPLVRQISTDTDKTSSKETLLELSKSLRKNVAPPRIKKIDTKFKTYTVTSKFPKLSPSPDFKSMPAFPAFTAIKTDVSNSTLKNSTPPKIKTIDTKFKTYAFATTFPKLSSSPNLKPMPAFPAFTTVKTDIPDLKE